MNPSDNKPFGDRVLMDLNLEVGQVESYVEAMMQLIDERMDLMTAGIRFCASELISEDNVNAREFLLKLAEGAEECMKLPGRRK